MEQIPDQKGGEKVLWASRCSKTKTGKDRALPNEFYVSPLNLLFYTAMEKYGLRYGICSDMYGMHMDDEYMDYYDVHPSTLSHEQKRDLGLIIGRKTREYGYEEIIFYNSSPLLSRPYFEMLWWADLPVYFISNIKLLDQKYGAPPTTKQKRGKTETIQQGNLF